VAHAPGIDRHRLGELTEHELARLLAGRLRDSTVADPWRRPLGHKHR